MNDLIKTLEDDSARIEEMRQLNDVLNGIEGYDQQPFVAQPSDRNSEALQDIVQQLNALRNHVQYVSSRGSNTPMLSQIDEKLDEIIVLMKNPPEKTLEFEVVNDRFNLPKKVIVSER